MRKYFLLLPDTINISFQTELQVVHCFPCIKWVRFQTALTENTKDTSKRCLIFMLVYRKAPNNATNIELLVLREKNMIWCHSLCMHTIHILRVKQIRLRINTLGKKSDSFFWTDLLPKQAHCSENCSVASENHNEECTEFNRIK